MPTEALIYCPSYYYSKFTCIFSKTETTPKKKGKESRVWDLGGSNKDAANLDIFNTSDDKDKVNVAASEVGIAH